MRRWGHYTGKLELGGRTPEYFGPLSHLRPGMLAFLESLDRPGRLPQTQGAIVLCHARDAQAIADAGHFPHVAPGDNPRETFWRLFVDAAAEQAFERLAYEVDASAQLAPTAVVGGPPFKVIGLDGKRRLAPHVGGVSIGPGACVGAHTCIDSGLYGERTEIHEQAFVDNLVHVGHSAVIGKGAKVVAGAVLGGWSQVGEGAWIGIGALVRDHVSVGAGAVVGMGAVVVKDVPAGVTVIGNPARPMD